MHMYAKCDENIPCGSRVMKIFTIGNELTDGRTHMVIIVQTQGSCKRLCLKLHISLTKRLF